jgi:hypothetical protein
MTTSGAVLGEACQPESSGFVAGLNSDIWTSRGRRVMAKTDVKCGYGRVADADAGVVFMTSTSMQVSSPRNVQDRAALRPTRRLSNVSQEQKNQLRFT